MTNGKCYDDKLRSDLARAGELYFYVAQELEHGWLRIGTRIWRPYESGSYIMFEWKRGAEQPHMQFVSFRELRRCDDLRVFAANLAKGLKYQAEDRLMRDVRASLANGH